MLNKLRMVKKKVVTILKIKERNYIKAKAKGLNYYHEMICVNWSAEGKYLIYQWKKDGTE